MEERLKTSQAIIIGRDGEIWTHDPCLPKTVLYQAELHPDAVKF